jgi:glycyl-tRNA synthetase beta chain
MTGSKIETGNWKLETGDQKLGTGNLKLDTKDAAAVELQSTIDNRKSSITLPLLLEVGCEEIPARFLCDAQKGLGERVRAALEESRLLPQSALGAVREPPLQTFSTPRRLVVYVPALLAQQPDKVEEILGPPTRVALDGEGKYTRAAESFAQKNSARVEDLARTTTPKGEYLSLRKTTQGRSAAAILAEILPSAILGLAFPKSMYWTEKSAPRFVRPIRWVLALLGEGKRAATVDFEFLGVKSGNYTFGHRSRGRKPQRVQSFKSYSRKLTQLYVDIDPSSRRQRVVSEAQALVENGALKIVQDEGLVDWIVNSTEWPHALLGSFDERFLHLPREILITVMRDHQKYFAVEQAGGGGAPSDASARLAPHFVTVLNMDSDERGLIRPGHERVLTARFRDAEFFWAADQKVPLAKRQETLGRVTFQAELGSYGDKVRRTREVAAGLCARMELLGKFQPHDTQGVLRAVNLCKCDLTAQMVQEFPELQGVVGGLYGQAQGEPALVYEAIYDHYLPLGAEGRNPRSLAGAVVSLADKLDSVVAGFAVGHEPTSSGDPYALRRLGNGIIKVLLEFKLPIDLSALIQEFNLKIVAGGGLGIHNSVPWPAVMTGLSQFFSDRLRFYLESVRGLRYDNVRAVVAAAPQSEGVPVIAPLDILQRAEALQALRGSEDLEALSAAAKRIRNILTKSAGAADWTPGDVAAELLSEPQEKELHEAYGRVAGESAHWGNEHDYRRALETISTLRPAVDRFFDKVLVMAEDPATRQNRLRLLKNLDELFSGIAQIAEIAEKQ